MKILLRCSQACIILVVCLFNFSLSAQNTINKQFEKLTINLDFNDSDGIFESANAVQAYLEIQNNTDEPINMQIEWSIQTDDWQSLKQMLRPIKLHGGSKVQNYCPLYAFPQPGFYIISATIKTESKETYKASKVVGIEPEKIRTPIDAEADFEAFWKTSLEELAKVNSNYTIIPQKREGNAKTNLFKVEMKSFGGLTVRGWLEVPKEKGVYPALLRVPGYTSNMKPIDKYEDLIVFSFNPRDHGESDSTGIRNSEMWVRGLESKENYYYRGVYLDCIRAIDFLCSRENVDTNRIAIWGGSQGGGLSFSTAALDDRIDLCIADIPWMCDWRKFFEITRWDEIDAWFAKHPEQTWQSMLKTFSYFDTKNMAKKISCPVIMGIGLQDNVCPPSTSFATYNYIESKKQFSVYKNAGHYQPSSHFENRFKFLRKAFLMD